MTDKTKNSDRPAAGGTADSAATGEERVLAGTQDRETIIGRAVEEAVLHGIFRGRTVTRRGFIRQLGLAGAMAVIADIFPINAAKALANDPPKDLEKTALKIGFIPINCATPIIMAHPMGFYEKHGLKGTEVVKGAGWAMIRDWAVSKQIDCAHMLAPMPLALTTGVGSSTTPFVIPALENLNGQAIVLHKKHKDLTEASQLKGMTLCIPFEFSIHNLLLRYYLAEGGVDPDKDVKLRVVNPAEMVANLKAENVDGFIGPEPFNQRAVFEDAGFIFKLTHDIWPDHPCCAFACSREFVTQMPNTFQAAFQAIVDATVFATDHKNRKDIAKAIAPRNYLNQPVEVIEQVLTGDFPDGLGNMRHIPDRISFHPFPWNSMAVWILTQMKRWGYLQGDVDYRKIADEVFLSAECKNIMEQEGYPAPTGSPYARHVIMGKEFDPANPQQYLDSFPIRRG
ncbi:CmpA/NrtA family ABC transporter substrate-binding protein [Solidesulfovibrio sp.]|uniref:CmpA/NrtA family ABC transporter substrate-binding protein n=1 Tax=Solidesulfovibrio sp. TaxID=2910990 RepID=UPI002616206E|nr:CmpA/NrtA family ABC transporter substrate-binding protein [Solidesulfovibrio sp.]